jgi:hypothetical protein
MTQANGVLSGAHGFDPESADALSSIRAMLDKEKGNGRGYKARKKAEKKIRATVSGGSLTETGRTKQFNFKALPQVHRAVMEAAAEEGITVSEWLEKLLLQHLGMEDACGI